MSKFDTHTSIEETNTYAMGELMDESRKEQMREAIESDDWPEDCQFGIGNDPIDVLVKREQLRNELGIKRKPQPKRWYSRRNHVRLSCDANGKCWTRHNGG